LIQSGRILSINTPQGIVEKFGKLLLAVKSDNMLQLLGWLKESGLVEDAYPFGEYHHAVMKNGGKAEMTDYLLQKTSAFELKEAAPNIEDCFMSLMKADNE